MHMMTLYTTLKTKIAAYNQRTDFYRDLIINYLYSKMLMVLRKGRTVQQLDLPDGVSQRSVLKPSLRLLTDK